MTTNELVAYLSDDLNVHSPEAKARIERELNVRYKQVTSAIGTVTTRREEISATATIGNRYLTFTGTEKLGAVYRKVGTKKYILDEMTQDDMLKATVRTEPAANYAIYSVIPTSVTIELDCVPTTAFILYATALGDVSTLSATVSPAIPESFHDILIHGVQASEYRRKREKELADGAESMFAQRLSDLRMFLAKSAYLDVHNSKNADGNWWEQ